MKDIGVLRLMAVRWIIVKRVDDGLLTAIAPTAKDIRRSK
jgi:hypothetical protein